MGPIVNKKRGDLMCTEPNTLNIINSSPAIRVAFENTCCIPFCKKVQKVGHNTRLTNMFSLNFLDGKVKLGNLEIFVTEKFIADATNLPIVGEKWFKGDEVDILAFKQFVKP